MELRYLVNHTMLSLAEQYFLPSVPTGFDIINHESDLYTSGDFDKDNYSAVITERTDAIQRELENRLDNSLMFWCDVDIEFYRDCAAELERLAEGKDLLFQKETEDPTDRTCNFGVQIIRRTPRNLVFYSRIALLQRITDNGNDQPWGNCLLGFEDAPDWGHLPLTYSAESNGGARRDSVLYHANCTPAPGSLEKKAGQLEAARNVVESRRKVIHSKLSVCDKC
jgi:hypothetical protein